MRYPRFLILLCALSLAAAACSGSGADEGDLTIVATTTILGDVVANVVGDDAVVEVVMPNGADPHDFQPSAADVALMSGADLVVANGLGLEEGLADVLASLEADGVTVLEIAPALDPIPFGGDGHGEGDAEDHDSDSEEDADHDEDGDDDHDGDDPHVWMDPLRMADAAGLIAGALATLDASVDWAAAAGSYGVELESAHDEIVSILAAVESRVMVTSHDAFGYFADRYDFEIVGTVIPGGATLADPSSQELAALVATMRAEGVDVVFVDTTENDGLSRAIVAELGEGAQVVPLNGGSLGEPGSGSDSLIGMLLANANDIADALG